MRTLLTSQAHEKAASAMAKAQHALEKAQHGTPILERSLFYHGSPR